MDVRNCRQCGRLFNYIGGSYSRLCPECIGVLEEKFQEVKEYIESNRTASMHKICEDCDVSAKQVEQWVREERLVFAEDSAIGVSCELCGATIKSGKYCDSCKTNMANQLGSAYGKAIPLPTRKTQKDSARMRFLENK